MIDRRAAKLAALAGAVLVSSPGCFDPDVSRELECGPGASCPGDLECRSGVCREGDSDSEIDASADPRDAQAAADASTAPSDADLEHGCNPVTHDECAAPSRRCAFVVTSPEPPFEGAFRCVEPKGDRALGQSCSYTNEEDDERFDDCRTGLLCSYDFVCRRPCELSQDCVAGPCDDLALGEAAAPYGLCELSPADAGSAARWRR